MAIRHSVLGWLLSACLVSGCHQAQSKQTATLPRKAIIVIPGFKGSVLEDENNRVVWVTLSEVLFGSRTLALPAPGVIPEVSVHATAILKNLKFLGLFGGDFYGDFLENLNEKCLQSLIVPFFYDWRKSASLAARELDVLVNSLHASGVEQIDLVGHSMGGLVVAWYLRYGSQTVETTELVQWKTSDTLGKVVLVATPFRGAYQILHDMKFGSSQGLNIKILDAKALSTFPSSYELLPSGSESIDKRFDVAFWEKERAGLFTDGQPTDEKRNFTTSSMVGAAAFKNKLLLDDNFEQHERPKTLVVVGKDTETPSVQATDNEFFPNLVPGDDTVPKDSAMLPTAFSKNVTATTITSNLPHYKMVDDPRIVDFLCSD